MGDNTIRRYAVEVHDDIEYYLKDLQDDPENFSVENRVWVSLAAIRDLAEHCISLEQRIAILEQRNLFI
jgi:hypothetical protein